MSGEQIQFFIMNKRKHLDVKSDNSSKYHTNNFIRNYLP